MSVDAQLLAMKQKLGMLGSGSASSGKALGAGQRDEEIAAEIVRPGDEKSS